jgi:hypothetical protein
MIQGHTVELRGLLSELGFELPDHPNLTRLLDIKVRAQIHRIATELRKTEILIVKVGEDKKETLEYAEWAEGWLKESWDGNPEAPGWMQLFLDPYFGDSRPLPEIAPVSKRKREPPAVELDNDPPSPDREIFVVEEPDELHEADDGAQAGENNAGLREPYMPVSRTIIASTYKMKEIQKPTPPLPGYKIDLSELPQYRGVQLTPADPNHPLRPHPDFKAAPSASNNEEEDNENGDQEYDADDSDAPDANEWLYAGFWKRSNTEV